MTFIADICVEKPSGLALPYSLLEAEALIYFTQKQLLLLFVLCRVMLLVFPQF